MGTQTIAIDASSFAKLLEALLAQGYQLPIHCAVLGANGSLIAVLFQKIVGDDGLSSVCTGHHFLDEGFVLPVNMLFVDSRGEATRVLVESDGRAQFMN
ncbi:MAG: hypothetical protein WCG85_26415 [Polyangia bacterium]